MGEGDVATPPTNSNDGTTGMRATATVLMCPVGTQVQRVRTRTAGPATMRPTRVVTRSSTGTQDTGPAYREVTKLACQSPGRSGANDY